MENTKTIRIEYLVYFLLVFNPLIDLVNGIFYYVMNNELPFSPGQIVRGLLLFFVLYHVYKSGLRQKFLLVLCFLLFGIQEVIHVIFNEANITTDVLFVSKIWFNLFLLFLLITYNEKLLFNMTKLINAFLFGASFISLVVIITALLGLGVESYGGVGNKGFFMGLNDISAIITMAIPLALYRFITSSLNKKMYFFVVLSLVTTMFLLGTKAPIVFGLFSLFYYLIFMARSQIDKKIFLIIIGSISLLIPFLYNNLQHIIARQLYHFERLNFFSFILSGRNKIAEVAADFFLQKWWFVFIGTGFTSGSGWIAENFDPRHGMIEMDFLDIFYFYGILFTGMVMVFILPTVFLAFKKFLNKDELLNKTISLTIIIGFLLSFLGGHILLSPLAGPYFIFIIVLGLSLFKKNKKRHKKTIIMIGPDINLKGGISTVIKQYYYSELSQKYKIILIPSMSNRKMTPFLSSIIKYSYLLMRKDVDLVHIHLASKGSFYRKFIFYLLTPSNIPYIVHVHGGGFINFYDKSPFLVKKLISNMFFNSSKIIVLSNQWKNEIEYKFNIPNSKIVKLINGINISNQAFKIKKNHKQILFLGKLIKSKGIYDLLDVIPIIVREVPDVKFVLAGDGDTQKVVELINEKKLESNVSVVGWVSGEEKQRYLNESSILVMPSYFEAFGISIVEAMNSGMAIVATNVGGIPEIIEDNKNGFLVEKSNLKELEESLLILLKDPLLIRQFSENNQITSLDYDQNKVFIKLNDIYTHIIK
jgi:glycosyltransferase involved in cell wall biosynthesis